jgi:hypothetical protein
VAYVLSRVVTQQDHDIWLEAEEGQHNCRDIKFGSSA